MSLSEAGKPLHPLQVARPTGGISTQGTSLRSINHDVTRSSATLGAVQAVPNCARAVLSQDTHNVLTAPRCRLLSPFNSVGWLSQHADCRWSMRASTVHDLYITYVSCTGLVTILAAKAFGAAQVVVTDMVDANLVLAATMGATATVRVGATASPEDVAADLKAALGGEGPNIVIDCAGFQDTMQVPWPQAHDPIMSQPDPAKTVTRAVLDPDRDLVEFPWSHFASFHADAAPCLTACAECGATSTPV